MIRIGPAGPDRRSSWRRALVGVVTLTMASCGGGSDESPRPTTSSPRSTTTGAPTVPPSTAATDPLDAAFGEAGYQTPIPDDVRIAVTTFCRATPSDLASNLTEGLRTPVRIGFQVVCPERLAELDAIPAG